MGWIDTQGLGHELVQVAPDMEARGSHLQATLEQEWAQGLHEIRRMVEFLARGGQTAGPVG